MIGRSVNRLGREGLGMAKENCLGDTLKILSCFSVFLSGFPMLTTSGYLLSA